MRDEWTNGNAAYGRSSADYGAGGAGYNVDSRSSQGLTRVGRQTESKKSSSTSFTDGLDRSASLTLAHKSMRLKSKGDVMTKNREISERRQVGDAEGLVNPQVASGEEGAGAGKRAWWRDVGMDEGL